MNRDELARTLETDGVPSAAYNLFGSHGDEGWVLDQRVHGWVVFYAERGAELELRQFAGEQEACHHLLNRIRTQRSV